MKMERKIKNRYEKQNTANGRARLNTESGSRCFHRVWCSHDGATRRKSAVVAVRPNYFQYQTAIMMTS